MLRDAQHTMHRPNVALAEICLSFHADGMHRVVQHDAVASGVFGPIQRGVGMRQQLAQLVARRCGRSHAEARRDGGAHTAVISGDGRDRCAQLLVRDFDRVSVSDAFAAHIVPNTAVVQQLLRVRVGLTPTPRPYDAADATAAEAEAGNGNEKKEKKEKKEKAKKEEAPAQEW